ncbi:VanZ family protein [Flavobacterium sp. ASW18X]|uniref:VanZ family protein n=1 Tax=Flavobacterium sp. ASW18X TaxID=2572595 RepID=UPI0010AE4202|nr:VanZ family protein [Flavobacterium sp. ASW18X]TKD66636.1 VanZ family protein [Flavobacterium sp. ASW18X]
MLKNNKYTILGISWLVLVTSLSLFSFSTDVNTGIDIPHLDKLVHFSFYFGVVLLGCLSLLEQGAQNLSRIVKYLIIFAIAYGLFIEILQYVMPYHREADIFDFLANSFGAIVAGLLIKKYRSLIYRIK